MKRQPYFFSQGDARSALEQVGTVWDVPDPIWCQLPDGRVYWGAWADGPFNTDPLLVAAALVMERDDRGRSLELPCLPALRPGMQAELREEGSRFLIRAATFTDDRVRLEWDKMDA